MKDTDIMFMNCKTRRSGQHSMVRSKLGKDLRRGIPRDKEGSRYRGSGFQSPTRGKMSSICEMFKQKSTRDVRNLPSIQLGRAEYDNPIVPRRVIRNKLFEDVAAQGSSAQDGQKFEGDNGGIGNAPSEIGTRVFFPCISEATCV
jgi:hypothetical protein